MNATDAGSLADFNHKYVFIQIQIMFCYYIEYYKT